MFKKVVILCAAVMGLSAVDAWAVPTVRKNGISNSSTVASRTGKLPTTVKTVDNRMSLTNAVKNFKVGKNTVTTNTNSGSGTGGNASGNTGGNTGGNGGNSNPGISSSDLIAITDRVSDLETQTHDMITDVVTSGTGDYVTDVAVNGHKLTVTKTNPDVTIPVRNNANEHTGAAEIWIVK